MRKKPKTQTVEQLDLFVPPPQRPTWTQLPLSVTQRLTELLAELLREKQRPTRPVIAKEAGDE